MNTPVVAHDFARPESNLKFTESEITTRAREGFIFSYRRMPAALKRWIRRGNMDWALAGARQALRDLAKPVEFLPLESRAAWALARAVPQYRSWDAAKQDSLAEAVLIAIRLGHRH